MSAMHRGASVLAGAMSKTPYYVLYRSLKVKLPRLPRSEQREYHKVFVRSPHLRKTRFC